MDTSPSLLERLNHHPDAADWRRWYDLYTPLIRNWLGGLGLRFADVEDLVQDVLAVVVRRLPEFRHNARVGAFRKWLRGITVNCLREHLRAGKQCPVAADQAVLAERLDQLADEQSSMSQQWDAEHDRLVMRKLLEQVRATVEPTTWDVFEQFALNGRSAAQVAQQFRISTNAVFIAKSRVLQKLRQEAAGLIE
ncbi:RNA polymerase sigma factor [Tuwongella immobilis]|uniref:RNA polymerase sigma-70 region 2 domain-containing protein n=1 Tax=Tuwongella immobilis TaxID=692036 RepID=A0A6C2YKZ6_9BACT|nr:sigma-70 family RNA polymerase sigma factor [Tuwongella immobilis]VIP02250.1 extracytoplasmic function alternative sigma factor : RNA polymerase, sigma-24 subunit, ECF subfamily OS=Pirellula staleyi (strain ATCC 27377 / DSM 6068 / ICPB 4128) GN=Psta_4560 PE=4 SV=1: Sigma70_r2 [Tuwongella immobilis]VTS00837.1 extracytoplasmic function alternative sigma factor : RNA polymerase, sigma-24 subunit, ECF subfamily OS=Pirellula staleyi (strain ATCC 27377 / DSM 6068 / ICPB 4128) GN=Psta_4560 PE=4 SV=1: